MYVSARQLGYSISFSRPDKSPMLHNRPGRDYTTRWLSSTVGAPFDSRVVAMRDLRDHVDAPQAGTSTRRPPETSPAS